MKPNYTLELAFDRTHCYPMETVILSVALCDIRPTDELLHIFIPASAEIRCISGASGLLSASFYTQNIPGGLIYSTRIAEICPKKDQVTLAVTLEMNTFMIGHHLDFSAWVESSDQANVSNIIPLSAVHARLSVFARARYLDYLPEVYSSDELLNRFLMFFESFWKPIQTQIRQSENYYDSYLCPPEFVSWLASWFGIESDAFFSENQLRRFIKQAVHFFNSRGTKQSLESFLSLFSCAEPTICEQRATNLVIGANAQIGEHTALGIGNQPNTIAILLPLADTEKNRQESYRQSIRRAIRGIIPAATDFSVDFHYQ